MSGMKTTLAIFCGLILLCGCKEGGGGMTGAGGAGPGYDGGGDAGGEEGTVPLITNQAPQPGPNQTTPQEGE